MTLQNDWRAEIEEMFQQIKEKEQVRDLGYICSNSSYTPSMYIVIATGNTIA